MKSLLTICAVVLCILSSVVSAHAKTEKGDIELSGAASYLSRKLEDMDETFWHVNIATRLGIYITNTIEIEPEIMFSKYKDDDLGYILSGNLVLNLSSIKPDSDVVLFFLGGFGVSNTWLYFQNIPLWGLDDERYSILNVGGGLKFFISRQAAFRLEYRFQKFFEEREITYHNIFFGISAFLK